MIRALRMKGAARRAMGLALCPMTGNGQKRYGIRSPDVSRPDRMKSRGKTLKRTKRKRVAAHISPLIALIAGILILMTPAAVLTSPLRAVAASAQENRDQEAATKAADFLSDAKGRRARTN